MVFGDGEWMDGSDEGSGLVWSEEEEEFEEPPGEEWQELRRRRFQDIAHHGSVNSVMMREVCGTSHRLGYESHHFFLPARSHHLPHALCERRIEGVERFNKIFAQVWLDQYSFVTGSKDNQLTLWDTSRNPHHDTKPTFRPLRLPRAVTPMPESSAGIHDVALSPDKRMLASGAENSNEMAIFDTTSWTAMFVCSGHKDWVFGCDWVSNDTLYSCGRDKTVMIWKVPPWDHDDHHDVGTVQVLAPSTVLLQGHADRVRALRYNARMGLVGTLGSDKRTVFWDVTNGDIVSRVETFDRDDLMCIAAEEDYGLFAVGGRDFVSIIDPRCRKILRNLKSPDSSMGVRSTCFRHNLLSMGGGMGRLAFFDLVADKFTLHPHMRDEEMLLKPYLRVSPGWMHGAHLDDELVESQAIYTHNWDPAGSKLFTGGGPLFLQVDGAFASVW